MMKLSFLQTEYPDCIREKAGFHVIPVPMEKGISYGAGAAEGPRAILEASRQLEAWDGVSAPGELGIYTRRPIDCGLDLERVLDETSTAVKTALRERAIPIILGGEHTVSYAPIRALAQAEIRFGILHFDAHCDLRDEYERNRWSHACVMRRVFDDFRLPVAQFGTREYSREEDAFRKENGFVVHDAAELARSMPVRILPPDFPENVYVSFDVDVFDSSLMPATGTPSPGGLFWHDAVALLERCLSRRRLVGFDVVELAPIKGLHHADFTAAKMVHALMGMAQRCMQR